MLKRHEVSGQKPLNMDVYQAFQKRMDFVVKEFDVISISFSGGKDSGVLLNLVMDYLKEHNIKDKKICIFHQDMECQYKATSDYVEETFKEFADKAECYWFCQPIESRNALSMFQHYWYPWDDECPEKWTRPMPNYPYVYTLKNNPFSLYEYKMEYHEHAEKFEIWLKQKYGGRVISLTGMRASESLNRYRAVINKVCCYKGKKWTKEIDKDVYVAYPIYDWTVNDIWIANAKFGYKYNHLYDLFYKAGVPLTQMRVASPFHDDAKNDLNMYRVIDPQIWSKLLCRVEGVNFAAIYGRTKAMGWNKVTMPKGKTWKEYNKFIILTLPAETRQNYVDKFNFSIQFWLTKGSGLSQDIIQKLYDTTCLITNTSFMNKDEINNIDYSITKNENGEYTLNFPSNFKDNIFHYTFFDNVKVRAKGILKDLKGEPIHRINALGEEIEDEYLPDIYGEYEYVLDKNSRIYTVEQGIKDSKTEEEKALYDGKNKDDVCPKISHFGKHMNFQVICSMIADETDVLQETQAVASWKRMTICLLKNDYLCKYMGFGLTKEQQKKVNYIKNMSK